MQVEKVQRWVMSALVLTTSVILATGLALLADSSEQPGARPGLLAIAAIIGVIAVAATRLLHRLSLATPWLVAGLIPAAVGWYLTSGR